MATRVALVTGATGAIGEAIARGIARHGQFEVVLVCRDLEKAERAAERIRQSTGNDAVRTAIADLSRRLDIEALAARWHGPLHVLVNNAATAPRRRQETPEGLEVQFATNILGYVWMVRAFTEALQRGAPSRVVNVASYWAGDLDLDDLQFVRRRYDNNTAYRQSKQANRMLTVAQAEWLGRMGIAVNACHPGDVNSQLSNQLGFGGHHSPDQGAVTPVWLATDPVGQERTGRYFANRREERCRFGEDRAAVERLYEACEAY